MTIHITIDAVIYILILWFAMGMTGGSYYWVKTFGDWKPHDILLLPIAAIAGPLLLLVAVIAWWRSRR